MSVIIRKIKAQIEEPTNFIIKNKSKLNNQHEKLRQTKTKQTIELQNGKEQSVEINFRGPNNG